MIKRYVLFSFYLTCNEIVKFATLSIEINFILILLFFCFYAFDHVGAIFSTGGRCFPL